MFQENKNKWWKIIIKSIHPNFIQTLFLLFLPWVENEIFKRNDFWAVEIQAPRGKKKMSFLCSQLKPPRQLHPIGWCIIFWGKTDKTLWNYYVIVRNTFPLFLCDFQKNGASSQKYQALHEIWIYCALKSYLWFRDLISYSLRRCPEKEGGTSGERPANHKARWDNGEASSPLSWMACPGRGPAQLLCAQQRISTKCTYSHRPYNSQGFLNKLL